MKHLFQQQLRTLYSKFDENLIGFVCIVSENPRITVKFSKNSRNQFDWRAPVRRIYVGDFLDKNHAIAEITIDFLEQGVRIHCDIDGKIIAVQQNRHDIPEEGLYKFENFVMAFCMMDFNGNEPPTS